MAFYAIAPVSFITTSSYMRSCRLKLRDAWLVMGSLQERERDVKPKGHLTPNDTLGEEGRVTEMVMEEECPSVCVALPSFAFTG